ncbi:hypothetical protein [Chondromyces crocatus]|uniref:Uncharacterized protein n=1 Tax=Chondromyces crocatus TaxID=52 RepID=A0A0K1E515_CHOCO|nr:hypothetical protein [Chondromyces crocatus]AKT35944.1 uncharacterized protein CMC5_000560 [Chondromyces crocatus]
MPWLWYVGPILVVAIYLITLLPGRFERRRERELTRWRELMRPTTPGEVDGPIPRQHIPAEFVRPLEELGGGIQLARFELHEKLAYVAVMGPDLHNSSEYQAVITRLAEPAPSMRVAPLAIIDGHRVANIGIKLKKDPGFNELFQIDGKETKRITRWLNRRVRDALRELPYAWLVTTDRTMALAIHGPVDADRLYALLTAADAIFAEHGDEDGPSLFYDEEDEAGDEREDAPDDDEDGTKSAKPPTKSTSKEAPRSAGRAG